MDKKTIIGLVIAAAVTAIVTWFITSQLTAIDEGADALTEQQIRTVVATMLVTPDGTSYGKALQDINLGLGTINTKLEGHELFRTEIRGDLNSIRRSMVILAGGAG